MKKIILAFFSLLIIGNLVAQPGGARLRFTAKKNPVQNNQFQIFVKNVSGAAISGNLGASLLTICIGVPISVPKAGLSTVITSPLVGQTFAEPLINDSGTTRIYTWNGTGSTGVIQFQPDVEVQVAAVTFGGVMDIKPVKLMNVINQGPSAFDNNYIAPGGTDQSDYSNPFYTSTSGILNNCNGTNDAVPTCTSTFTVDGISLPTKFVGFFATKSDDIAKLTWTVDNEENNAYFEVERSLDGRNFIKAYQVQALRNGRTSNTYTTPDANISRQGVKVIYYRIKQVETSGQIVYSEIRQVNLTDKNFAASLFPNPVKTVTKLVIDAPEAAKANVIIRDAAGKTVKAISLQLVRGINQQQLDATMFAAGDYNVTIVSEKLNQTIKMTKTN